MAGTFCIGPKHVLTPDKKLLSNYCDADYYCSPIISIVAEVKKRLRKIIEEGNKKESAILMGVRKKIKTVRTCHYWGNYKRQRRKTK